MGQQPKPRPQHLAAKLLVIRRAFRASQSELAKLLNFNLSCARISEYEHGIREPNLIVLLRYAKVAGISTDVLIDDAVEVDALAFRLEP